MKLIKRNMENTHPFLQDGSATTSTESRCRTLEGLSRTSCYFDRIASEKSFVRRIKSWENSKLKTLDSKIESGWCSATVYSTTPLCSSEKRMQEFTRRTYGKDPAGDSEEDKRSKELKDTTVRSIVRFYTPARRNLSPSSPSSSSTNRERNNWTTRSWNSWHSSRSDLTDHSWNKFPS